jgi:hypothetical protein
MIPHSRSPLGPRMIRTTEDVDGSRQADCILAMASHGAFLVVMPPVDWNSTTVINLSTLRAVKEPPSRRTLYPSTITVARTTRNATDSSPILGHHNGLVIMACLDAGCKQTPRSTNGIKLPNRVLVLPLRIQLTQLRLQRVKPFCLVET